MGAMNRISNYTHPDVFVERGDAVIFSSKIIPGNEKKLYKLHNQLVREGIEVISEDSEFIHVSGHPNREDLKDMYDWIKPRSVIPVHGEHRHMIEHINFAKEMQVPYPVRVENGDIVRIYPGDKPEVYDKAPSGRLYVDGSISVEEDAQSIKERKNLSTNGLIEATLVITPNGNIHNKPLLTFRGLPIYEKDEFTFNLEEEIEKTAKTFSLNNKKQESNLIDALKITCRKYTKEKLGKRPYTNINLVRIWLSITGSIVVYVCLWWIVFFAILPIDVNREKKGNIEGVDPGAPENPKITKKIIYCTLITSGIFIVIYLLVINEILNLRNFLN